MMVNSLENASSIKSSVSAGHVLSPASFGILTKRMPLSLEFWFIYDLTLFTNNSSPGFISAKISTNTFVSL